MVLKISLDGPAWILYSLAYAHAPLAVFMAGYMLRIILESMFHCSDMSNGKKVGCAREDGEGWGGVCGGWGYN